MSSFEGQCWKHSGIEVNIIAASLVFFSIIIITITAPVPNSTAHVKIWSKSNEINSITMCN